METFNVSEMLNSTEMSRFLCQLGIGHASSCEPRKVAREDVNWKDVEYFVRVFLYCVIFLLSVVGNSFIIAVLGWNRRMRTVTNLFLLSLAISDLMVSLVCIPFTLIPNIMKTFHFGNSTCKIVMYFMGVSVSVSTYNLMAIALERYSAICRPLSSRTWQTKSHAAKVITATWLTSMTLMMPYIFSSSLKPFRRRDNTEGYMCRMMWQEQNLLAYWYTSLLLLLFFLPGIVILTAYSLISVELYKGIRFELSNRTSARDRPASFSSLRAIDGDGCYLHLKKRNAQAAAGARVGLRGNTANLLAKKRVVRMLLVIVCLFFLCWTPIFVVNAWQAYDPQVVQRLSGVPISFIHLLSYTSTCVNPVVYCFMNRRFRQGMKFAMASLQLRARVVDVWNQIIDAKWYEGPEESALHKRQARRREKEAQKRQTKRQSRDQRRSARHPVVDLAAAAGDPATAPETTQAVDPDQVALTDDEDDVGEQIGETYVELYADPYPEQNPGPDAERSGIASYISLTSVRSLLPPEVI
ncbi:cholecystokinin receptor type A-like [Stigmatopora nigra]